jgi:two-component system, LytTR family, sensor kinase
MKSRWAHWIAGILLWSALGVLFSLHGISSPGWNRQLLGSLTFWWAWGLVTPLIFWTDARLPFQEKQLGMRILAHLPVSVALTLLYTYLWDAMVAVVGLAAWSSLGARGFFASVSNEGICGNVSCTGPFSVRGRLSDITNITLIVNCGWNRMERSFSEARLNALRMQLDPHFLFNALNTISSQVERDPRLARTMIEHLGDLLRLSLEARDRQEISLVEELAFLDHYVAIQKIRFAENLSIDINVAPEVKYALVPALIVQPLVENAIRHGVSRRASVGTVTVVAEGGENEVHIHGTDDGIGDARLDDGKILRYRIGRYARTHYRSPP